MTGTVQVSTEIVLIDGGGWWAIEMICTCLGISVGRGSNEEKWGNHRKKNFFINNSVEALIPLKEAHQDLETACKFWGEGDSRKLQKCTTFACMQLIN